MQPYQEEYIANIKEITALTARKIPKGQSFEAYYAAWQEDRIQVEQKTERNMELLRTRLLPVLDHMPEADSETLAELGEFAEQLLNSREELDAGLFCRIHHALLSLARQKKDRGGMIRELYWLGIGANNLCNRLVGLADAVSESYYSQMRMYFAEAAAYLKYYDEITDSETRGYIVRSRANMALGKFKDVNQRIRMLQHTLQIMQDKGYQEKAPELPWDAYIYATHQLMAASISYSREETMTAKDVEVIMESVYLVYQRRIREAEQKKERPPVRPLFSYAAISYYCGLINLEELFKRMEELLDAADPSDFSLDGMYGVISLPAFYCQYLQQYPEQLPQRKEYVEALYRKILQYVEDFPDGEQNETLFLYLRQLSHTFVETEDSISYGEFLQKLQLRFVPDIFVHSFTVGKAAVVLSDIILKEEPDFFDDIAMFRELEDGEEKRRRILDYAMECGMYHDIGKINFMNLYCRTARQWFEEEYEEANLHTLVGETCLAGRDSTRCYADAAKGHHCWYDGTKGYPESYKRLECQYRQMIDVIGLVDWIDGVTETDCLHKGVKKTFDEAVETAISLEGRRFSPLLTARLRDKNVAEKLRDAFSEGRREAYRTLYEGYVGKEA